MDYYKNFDFKEYLLSMLEKSGSRLLVRLVSQFTRKGKTYSVLSWHKATDEPVLMGNNEEGDIYFLPVSVLNNEECRVIVGDIIKSEMRTTSKKFLSKDGFLTDDERKRLLARMRDLTDIHEYVEIYN